MCSFIRETLSNGRFNPEEDKMEDKEKEFAQIIREHKWRIYTVCYMFSKDADEVADLFQEILINMWKGFPSFRGESSIGTWIWRVRLNTCIRSGSFMTGSIGWDWWTEVSYFCGWRT